MKKDMIDIDYVNQVNDIITINELYLSMFYNYLVDKGFSYKIINRDIKNIDLYINIYLNIDIPQTMDNGCYCIDDYLGQWILESQKRVSKYLIKSNCISIRKFYRFMLDQKLITKADYKHLILCIKELKNEWLVRCSNYINGYVDHHIGLIN